MYVCICVYLYLCIPHHQQSVSFIFSFYLIVCFRCNAVIPTYLCQRLCVCVCAHIRKLPLIQEYYITPKPHLNTHNVIYSNRQKEEVEKEEEEEQQQRWGRGRGGGKLHWEKQNFCWRNPFKVKSFI